MPCGVNKRIVVMGLGVKESYKARYTTYNYLAPIRFVIDL